MMLPAYALDHAPVAYEIQLHQQAVDFADSLMTRTQSAPVVSPKFPVHTSVVPVETSAPHDIAAGGLDESGSGFAMSRVSNRAEFARIAFASGWLFLAIALFCFAQSFSVIAPETSRRWRSIRAHS